MKIQIDSGEKCEVVVPTIGHASAFVRILDEDGGVLCDVYVTSDGSGHPRRAIKVAAMGAGDGRAIARVPGGSLLGGGRLEVTYDRSKS